MKTSLARCVVVAAIPAKLSFAAVITPIGSDRFVSVTNRENSPATTVSFSGPALGPWNASAYKANLTTSDPNANPFGSAFAVTSSQQSNFDSGGIVVSALTNLDYQAIVPPNNGGSAINRCFVSFHVEEPCDYQFVAAYVSFQTSIETTWSVTLMQGSTQVFSQPTNGTLHGTLLRGDYELRVQIDGACGGTNRDFDSRLQIDASLTVPTPAALPILAAAGLFAARRRR